MNSAAFALDDRTARLMVIIPRNKFGGFRLLASIFKVSESKQAPGFTPGEVDVRPSHDRPTTPQAAGFIPGEVDLSNLSIVG